MATLPYTITDGDVPSAVPLMANFNYLLGGAGIKSDTYANLVTAAALAPTVPFLCVATDQDLFLLYCGKATRGNGGFLTLQSFGEIV